MIASKEIMISIVMSRAGLVFTCRKLFSLLTRLMIAILVIRCLAQGWILV